MGIGDLSYDRFPIQASQFESDIRIAEQLEKVYFEFGGGGNFYESYTAAWYFGARHTKLDCWNRGKKGIIITIGDERLNPYLPRTAYYCGLSNATGDSLEDTVKKIASNNLMMFYPDAGAMKRYSSAVHLPYAFGIKNRDWETGEIKGLDLSGEIDQLPGKDILIVDDICSRGGTFYYSAKKLKEAGVGKIYLYITHCENTIYEGELLKNNGLIEKIYTTDTILTNLESPKIELVERFR